MYKMNTYLNNYFDNCTLNLDRLREEDCLWILDNVHFGRTSHLYREYHTLFKFNGISQYRESLVVTLLVNRNDLERPDIEFDNLNNAYKYVTPDNDIIEGNILLAGLLKIFMCRQNNLYHTLNSSFRDVESLEGAVYYDKPGFWVIDDLSSQLVSQYFMDYTDRHLLEFNIDYMLNFAISDSEFMDFHIDTMSYDQILAYLVCDSWHSILFCVKDFEDPFVFFITNNAWFILPIRDLTNFIKHYSYRKINLFQRADIDEFLDPIVMAQSNHSNNIIEVTGLNKKMINRTKRFLGEFDYDFTFKNDIDQSEKMQIDRILEEPRQKISLSWDLKGLTRNEKFRIESFILYNNIRGVKVLHGSDLLNDKMKRKAFKQHLQRKRDEKYENIVNYAEAQTLGSYNPITFSRNVYNGMERFLQNIDEIPNKVNAFIDELSRLIQPMIDTLDSVTSFVNTLKYYLLFCLCLVLLWTLPLKYSSIIVGAISILLFLFDVKGANLLKEKVSYFYEKFVNNTIRSESYGETGVTAFLSCLLMGSSMFLVNKIPDDRDTNNFIRKLDSVPRALGGIEKIWNYVASILPRIQDFICIYVLKLEGYIPQMSSIQEVDEWINKINEYLHLDTIQLKKKTLSEVIVMSELYNKGLQLMTRCTKESWGKKTQELIGRYLAVAFRIQELAASTGMIASQALRDQPTSVLFSGFPGVGKSYLSRYVPAYIMTKLGYAADNIIPNIYNVITDNEFWDAYNNQFCVMFDDFGQKVDSANSANLDFYEFIRCANTSRYPLTMAELNNKGNVNFTSELIVGNTNIMNLGDYIHSIVEKEAIARRWDSCWFTTIKPEFRIDSNPELDPTDVRNKSKVRLDTSKIDPNSTNLDVWEFYQYDCLTGIINKSKKFTYQEMVKNIYDRFSSNRSKSIAFNRNIKQYISEVRAEAQNFEPAPERLEMMYQESQENEYRESMALINELRRNLDSIDSAFFNFVREVFLEERETYFERLKRKTREAIYTFNEERVRIQFRILQSLRFAKEELTVYFDSFVKSSVAFWKKFNDDYPIITKILKYVVMFGGIAAAMCGVYSLFSSNKKKDTKAIITPKREFTHVPDIYKHLILDESRTFSINELGNTVLFFKAPVTCKWCYGRRYCFLDEHPRCLDCKRIFEELCYDKEGKLNLYNEGKSEMILPKFTKAQNTELHNPIRPQSFERNINQARSIIDLVSLQTFDMELILRDNSKVRLNNCLFIKGHVGIMNLHAKIVIERKRAETILFKSRTIQQGFEVSVSELKFVDCFDNLNRRMDVTFFEIPISCMRFRDITKHFITIEDLHKFIPTQNSNITGHLVTYNSPKNTVESLSATSITRANDLISELAGVGSEKFYNTLKYVTISVSGDCGSALICNNVFINKPILGIHMAGDKTHGYATLITQELIKEYLQKFTSLSTLSWNENEMEKLHCQTACSLLTDGNRPPGDFQPIAKFEQKMSSPNINNIIPSKFFDQISIAGEKQIHTKLPSILGFTRDSQGNKVDLLVKGLSKMGNKPIRIDEKKIDIAISSFKEKFMHLDPEWENRKILSYEEAVQGVEGANWDHGCNRKSSMGFPYNIPGKQRGSGKRAWFGNSEWTLDSPLAIELKHKHEKIWKQYEELSESHIFICTDMLKKEKLPIEKILAQKTRVFAAGNMDFYLIFKRLFGSFLNMMKKNRIIVESCVGMNVYSHDVNTLVKELNSKGTAILAGDFSRFDATVNSQILMGVIRMINDWYDDDYAEQRYAIGLEIINSLHIYDDNIYMWTHSQPSGQPATAEFNCLYVSLAMRIVMQNIAPYPVNFNKNFGFVTYGDDTLFSFDETKFGDWLNYDSVSKGWATIGMEYTDETKTATMTIPWKSLDQISFLKRHIRYDNEIARWTMPLFKTTIIETMYWHEKKINSDEQLLDNCNNSLLEASLHGEEYYNELAKEIQRLCCEYKLKLYIPDYFEQLTNRVQGTILYGLWDRELNCLE